MRAGMLGVLLTVPLLATGCLGGGSRYARYQHKQAALRRIDALVATIPQYAGARRTLRQDFSTSYKLDYDTYIDAEPCSSALYYDLSLAAARRRQLPQAHACASSGGRFHARLKAGDDHEAGAAGTQLLRAK